MKHPTTIAVALFIASEAVFFLLLITAYVYYHQAGGRGPTAASVLDVPRTAVFTAALLASSVTAWRAEASLARRRRTRARLWLLATIVLGAVFLVGQGSEYAGLLRDHVTISRNLFGTTFFTLTGFHGAHVAVGLIMLSTLFGIALGRNPREPTAPALQGISWYWHFVDGVWVVVFSVVYLWKFA